MINTRPTLYVCCAFHIQFYLKKQHQCTLYGVRMCFMIFPVPHFSHSHVRTTYETTKCELISVSSFVCLRARLCVCVWLTEWEERGTEKGKKIKLNQINHKSRIAWSQEQANASIRRLVLQINLLKSLRACICMKFYDKVSPDRRTLTIKIFQRVGERERQRA